MNINKELIQRLKTANMSLTHYFLLYCLANDLDWHVKMKEDRMSSFTYLRRRGYLNDTLNVTEKGNKLLEGNMESPKVTKSVSIDNKDQLLNEWFSDFWNAFPTSDKFKHYPRTRTLRSNKIKAFKLYKDIMERGEYNHEQILKALNTDVQMKQKASIVTNQLRYMQTICTWLNKRIYEGFIEDTTEQESSIPENRYGEDIS